MDLKQYIASIPDFPKKGIIFRDITPLVQNGEAFREAVDRLSAYAEKTGAEVIAAPESRGFIFGCPMAYKLGIGFAPVRKPGKLPRKTISCSYDLEYGSNELNMHADSIAPGQKVLVMDDLLATGGTAKATINMVERMGGRVVGVAFLIELVDLKGREELKPYDVYSILTYEGE